MEPHEMRFIVFEKWTFSQIKNLPVDEVNDSRHFSGTLNRCKAQSHLRIIDETKKSCKCQNKM